MSTRDLVIPAFNIFHVYRCFLVIPTWSNTTTCESYRRGRTVHASLSSVHYSISTRTISVINGDVSSVDASKDRLDGRNGMITGYRTSSSTDSVSKGNDSSRTAIALYPSSPA